MSNMNDFIIENGVLKKYTGSDSMVDIPDGVTSIGEGAFRGFKNLTSVIIPDSVERIGKEAFSGCSSIENVTIPDSVWSISSGAFSNCTSLTSITISNSVDTQAPCVGSTESQPPDCQGSPYLTCFLLSSITVLDCLCQSLNQ